MNRQTIVDKINQNPSYVPTPAEMQIVRSMYLHKFKPSKLLTIALRDLESCEQDPDFEIDMGYWVHKTDTTCLVCMAGAVMVKSLGVQHSVCAVMDQAFSAINSFRLGNVDAGFNVLGRKRPDALPKYTSIPLYELDSEKFKQKIRELISLLEEHHE